MKDYLIYATADNGKIRAVVATTTGLVEKARKCHNTLPTASAALGRTLTGALLLGATLKNDDSLTIRVFGDGSIGGIIAQVDANNQVRGYVQEPATHLPANSLGKLDVGGAVGKGFIYVTKDLGIGEPYTGSVPLVSGEIAEDITHYLYTSEQVPSVCGLGVLVETDNSVRAAGGFLVQLLPGAEESLISNLEENLKGIKPISQMVDEGLSPEEILRIIFGDTEVKVLDTREVYFKCTCTRDRLEQVLISLGQEELTSLLEEQGQADLCCHFCNEKYCFNKEDLKRILKEAKS